MNCKLQVLSIDDITMIIICHIDYPHPLGQRFLTFFYLSTLFVHT